MTVVAPTKTKLSMNLKDRILKKSNLWHLGAIALFLIISCSYFSPALKGYTIEQGDIVRFVGMSREVDDFRTNDGEQVLWTNAMFAGMPTTQISMRYEGTWLSSAITSIVRLGLPAPIFFLFVYFISFYILALSLRLRPYIGMIGALAFGLSSYFIVILEAGHNSKAAAIGLAPLMIAGFIMAYRFKNWILGVALSATFMMVELSANHIQITYYMAFVLLVLGIAELARHIAIKKLAKFAKVTGAMLVGYVFAVLANYGNLIGTADYAKNTIRGGTELTINANGESNEDIKTDGLDRAYVTNWSYGIDETFTLFVPNFKGGETQLIGQNKDNKDLIKDLDVPRQYKDWVSSQGNQYFGDQPFTSGPVYIGIIVMLLAELGMVYVKDRFKWALLSITLLAIMLSWGKNYVSAFVLLPIICYNINVFLTNRKTQLITTGVVTFLLFFGIAKGDMFVEISLTDFFLDAVPGYNKLRAVTIILAVAELCIPIIGVLFLQRLFKNRKEIAADKKGFYIVSGVFVLFFLILLAAPNMFNSFLSMQELASLESATGPQAGQIAELFSALEEIRIAIFKKDVLRSFGFLVLGIGLIFAFLQTNFSKYIFGSLLGVLILVDLLVVDMRYLNTEGTGKNYAQWTETYKMRYPFTAGEGEKQILAAEIQENPIIQSKIDSALTVLSKELKESDASGREKQVRKDYLTYRILNRYTNFRVFEVGNPFNSAYTSYFNKAIGGYHGAKLGRYQDLIEFHLSKQNPAVIDMLNTKYYLRPEYGNGGKVVNSSIFKKNNNAMGNAWFSKDVKLVADANEEILAMDSYNGTRITNKGAGQVFVNGNPIENASLKGNEAISILLPGMTEPMPVQDVPFNSVDNKGLALIADSTGTQWIYDVAPDSLFVKIFSLSLGGRAGWDPAQTTIIDKRYESLVNADKYSGDGVIEMTSYHPDRLSYKSSSSDSQLAVFSEIFYEDGWKATVDGNETDVIRVNYVLRALELPAGEHEIVFEFVSPSYDKAGSMGTIGSIAILGLLIFGLFVEVKRKDNGTDEEDLEEEEELEVETEFNDF